MKSIKRIIAGLVATTMALSAMCIGASASDYYEYFNLRYRDDETNNVIVQVIGTKTDGTYHITVSGQLTVNNYITGIYGKLESKGYVWDYTHNNWASVVTQTLTTASPVNQSLPKTGYYLYASVNNPGRARQALKDLSQTSAANARGSVWVY